MITYSELLDELAAEYLVLPALEPGDVTKYTLAGRTGQSTRRCGYILDDKVMKGLLRRVRKRFPSDQPVVVYEKVNIA
jgi:hypothetical protein